MDLDKETSKKIEELQILESHLQGLLGQKQSFQLELNELNNAFLEVEKLSNKEEIYRISYGIMIKTPKDRVLKDLDEKKKIVVARISSEERQQAAIEKNISDLREEISGTIMKKKK